MNSRLQSVYQHRPSHLELHQVSSIAIVTDKSNIIKSEMSSNTPTAYSTVLYANTADLRFDMDYYLKVHMPLCGKLWGPHGLQSWQVIKFDTHPDGSRPKYAVQAILHWSKPEDLQVVMDEKISKPAFEDVKVFTNEKPLFMVGAWSGSATVERTA